MDFVVGCILGAVVGGFFTAMAVLLVQGLSDRGVAQPLSEEVLEEVAVTMQRNEAPYPPEKGPFRDVSHRCKGCGGNWCIMSEDVARCTKCWRTERVVR